MQVCVIFLNIDLNSFIILGNIAKMIDEKIMYGVSHKSPYKGKINVS